RGIKQISLSILCKHKKDRWVDDLQDLFSSENIAFDIDTPCGLKKKIWFEIMAGKFERNEKRHLCRRCQSCRQEICLSDGGRS
ncbi:hypothetical protein MAR_015433, partial [Mya arenaria]